MLYQTKNYIVYHSHCFMFIRIKWILTIRPWWKLTPSTTLTWPITELSQVTSHNVTRPKPELNCELPDQCQCWMLPGNKTRLGKGYFGVKRLRENHTRIGDLYQSLAKAERTESKTLLPKPNQIYKVSTTWKLWLCCVISDS